MTKQLETLFPKEGPINVLLGVNVPGANWSEQRAAGVVKALDDFKAANPGRQLTVTKLDVGADPATTSDRVGAYLNAHPDTTAYIETGSLDVAVAQWLKDRGIPPGKIIIGGFDVESDVLQEMKSGYIQAHADQQPYMQGFMPVMEVYLAKTVGLAPSDIDTGNGLVVPSQATPSPRWPRRASAKADRHCEASPIVARGMRAIPGRPHPARLWNACLSDRTRV